MNIFFPYALVSHMVIEEVSCIQNNLELEKICRESAEALATKVKSNLLFFKEKKHGTHQCLYFQGSSRHILVQCRLRTDPC